MGYILFANYLGFPDFIVSILEKIVNVVYFPRRISKEAILEIVHSPLLQGEPDDKCPDNDIFVRIHFFLSRDNNFKTTK